MTSPAIPDLRRCRINVRKRWYSRVQVSRTAASAANPARPQLEEIHGTCGKLLFVAVQARVIVACDNLRSDHSDDESLASGSSPRDSLRDFPLEK